MHVVDHKRELLLTRTFIIAWSWLTKMNTNDIHLIIKKWLGQNLYPLDEKVSYVDESSQDRFQIRSKTSGFDFSFAHLLGLFFVLASGWGRKLTVKSKRTILRRLHKMNWSNFCVCKITYVTTSLTYPLIFWNNCRYMYLTYVRTASYL